MELQVEMVCPEIQARRVIKVMLVKMEIQVSMVQMVKME